MHEWNDPKLTFNELVEVLHEILVPHEVGFPRSRLRIFTLQIIDSLLSLTTHGFHSISNLAKYVLLQTVRQIVRIRKVEASLVNFKRLKHIDKEILIIAIGVIC